MSEAEGRVGSDAAIDGSEASWIDECKRGRRAAFEPLVRRYGPRAYRFAVAMVGDAEEAKDLSQEAFIRAFGAIGRFDSSRPFHPWLLAILRNLCLSHLRRRRPRVALEDVPAPEERRGISPEIRLAVEQALVALPDSDREILVLKVFADLSYAEIAEVLAIPRGTVMSRLHHARRRFKDALDGRAR